MRLSLHVVSFAVLAIVSSPSFAADEDINSVYQAKNANETITLDIGFGYMNAKAHELVYDTTDGGRKLSELIWEMDSAAVAQVGLGFKLSNDLALKLRGTFGIDGDSYMEDYDWLDNTIPDTWTHLSQHDDTRLNGYNRLDAALQWDFADLDPVSIGALLGVRVTNIKWSAHGGDYTYTTTTLRDTTGSFPDGEKGITYEQIYGTPYLGLTAGFDNGDFAMSGSVIASVVAKGSGEDHHWARNLVFEDDLELSTMFSLQAEAIYRFNPSYQFFVNAEYERYADTKGATDVFDMLGNLVLAEGDGTAGSDHTSLTAVAGLRFAY